MTRIAKSVEELFPLVAHARAGDLKSVKAWIDAGEPLNFPVGKKTKHQSPLQVAIDKGFLTLTEMLLDSGADPKAAQALRWAVKRGRIDIARLLLDRGAEIADVGFGEVCFYNNAEMVRLFLDRGADPVTGAPFARALCYALQPLLGVFKNLLEKNPALQPQADEVLAHYIEERNLRGISLMVWAGARPDGGGPSDEDGDTDTPLEVAARSGDVAVLKALKPEKYPALLPRLVQAASGDASKDLLNYLLSIGAPLNDNPDGTSSLLSMALWRIGLFARPGIDGYIDSSRVDQAIDSIQELLAKGAKFPPMEVKELRSNLRHLPQERLFKLIGILQKVLPPGTLLEVITTAKFREILGTRWPAAARIASGEPETPPAPTKMPPPKPEPQDPEVLRQRAEDALVYFLKHHEPIPFIEREVSKTWTEGEFIRRIKLDDEDRVKPLSVLKDACRSLSKRLKSVEVTVETSSYHSFPYPVFRLKPDARWEEAIREMCQIPEGEPMPMSAKAEKLLNLAETETGTWFSRPEFSRRVGGPAHVRIELRLCEEIAARRGIRIRAETRRSEKAPNQDEVSLRVVSRPDPALTGATPKTVVAFRWEHSLDYSKKADVDRFAVTLFGWILGQKPSGKDPLVLFRVHTPAGLAKAFPKAVLTRWDANRGICGMLGALRMPEGVKVSYDLQESSPEWWAALVPTVSWEEATKAIQAHLNRPTPEKEFGLSHDAARLLEWALSRDPKEMLGPWTPVVEPVLGRQVGITATWPEENLPALLQLLVEEITEKTPYALSLVPWKEHGQVRTRIKVAKKAVAPVPIQEPLSQRLARAAREAGLGLSDEDLGKLAAALGSSGS